MNIPLASNFLLPSSIINPPPHNHTCTTPTPNSRKKGSRSFTTFIITPLFLFKSHCERFFQALVFVIIKMCFKSIFVFWFAVPPPNRAYLRTLIHSGDLEHLEKVVLDGHGHKLVHETATLEKVTKFIYALPDFMVWFTILLLFSIGTLLYLWGISMWSVEHHFLFENVNLNFPIKKPKNSLFDSFQRFVGEI